MYNTADGDEKLKACSSKFGGNRVTQNDQRIIQKGHIIRRPSTGSLSQCSSQRIKTHAGPYPYKARSGSSHIHHNSGTARD